MVPELRPRGIGEQLDLGVVLYRRTFKRLMLVTLAVVVPVQALSTVVLLSAQPDSVSPSLTGDLSPSYDYAEANSVLVQLAAVFVIFVIGVISEAFISGVCTRIVADAYVGHRDERGAATRIAFRRFFALTGLAFVVAITRAMIIPYALFAVAIPVLILEGTGLFKALGRSFDLTKSSFLRVLGVVVTAQALVTLLSFGLAAGVALLFRNDDSSSAVVITQGLANTVASVLTTPLVAAAIVACYFDLRIRSEAFDVQLLMQRNDARRAQQPAMPAAAR
jgi:hypothetical protein